MNLGIRELRDGLSKHIAAVRNGDEITVTDHGRPVARIIPVGQMSGLESLMARGIITPAIRPGGVRPDPVMVDGDAAVTELIAEQRR